MKRLFFAIWVLAVMFAVGCTKEKFEIPAPEYQLVVNMGKSSFDDSTRAPRNSWEDGDEVAVVFNGDVNSEKVVKYLKLTYVAATDSWTPEWVGTTPAEIAAKETKTCVAVYHSLGVNEVYYSGTSLYISASWNYGTEFRNLGGCVLWCNDGTFAVNEGVITLNIQMIPHCVQYTVRDISVEEGESWKLSLIKEGSSQTQEVYVGTAVKSDNSLSELSTKDYSMYGHRSDDGVAFFGRNIPQPRLGNYTFTLTNGTDTYTRNFNITSTISNGAAIIMNGPFNDNGTRNEDWTEVE